MDIEQVSRKMKIPKLRTDGFDDQIKLKFQSLKFIPTSTLPLNSLLFHSPSPQISFRTTSEFNLGLAKLLHDYDPIKTVRHQVFLRQKIPFVELMEHMENTVVEPDTRTFDLVCAHCFLIKDFGNARLNIPFTSVEEQPIFKRDSFTGYVYDLDVKGATRQLQTLFEQGIEPPVESLIRFINIYMQDKKAIAKAQSRVDPSTESSNLVNTKSDTTMLIIQVINEFNMQESLKIGLNRLLKMKLALGDEICLLLYGLMNESGIEISPTASSMIKSKLSTVG